MAKIDVFQPSQLFSNDPPALESFGFRFLAEGDSWFSIGTLNLLANSNLLFEMDFQRSACAVNCATPGDTLKRMTQLHTDPNFIALLFGRQARFWDAILMSCGGNDLIEAVGSPAVDGAGNAVPPARRLLLTRDEWGPASQGAARYLSDAGWQTFCTYLQANFDHLIALRERGPSRGQPVFVHGYAFPVPRPAGAGLGAGPWIWPSLLAYAIPAEDAAALAHELLVRLGRLLAATAADGARFPNLHFFDSAAVALTPAQPGTSGVSGDWINEIHLTRAGYRKIAVPWAAAVEAAL
jgi:hypothetical protein